MQYKLNCLILYSQISDSSTCLIVFWNLSTDHIRRLGCKTFLHSGRPSQHSAQAKISLEAFGFPGQLLVTAKEGNDCVRLNLTMGMFYQISGVTNVILFFVLIFLCFVFSFEYQCMSCMTCRVFTFFFTGLYLTFAVTHKFTKI